MGRTIGRSASIVLREEPLHPTVPAGARGDGIAGFHQTFTQRIVLAQGMNTAAGMNAPGIKAGRSPLASDQLIAEPQQQIGSAFPAGTGRDLQAGLPHLRAQRVVPAQTDHCGRDVFRITPVDH